MDTSTEKFIYVAYFPSVYDGGKYFTQDKKVEVSSREYVKCINKDNLHELSKEEILLILISKQQIEKDIIKTRENINTILPILKTSLWQ